MPNKGVCPVCKYTYSNMMMHLMKMKDRDHVNYIEKINFVVDKLVLETDLYIEEICDEVEKQDLFISKYYISLRVEKLEPERSKRIISSRKMGYNNPSQNEGTLEKFSKMITDKWLSGKYKDIITNVLNKTGIILQNYAIENSPKDKEPNAKYINFLSNFEDVTKCNRCNSTKDISIKHIDENYSNMLISNLEVECKDCYDEFNTKNKIMPFVTIGKKLSFAAAHKLPHHLGKCENWHGHEWVIEVCIRRRIDPVTLMVVDFKELKTVMNKYIINVLDHNSLNDFIEIPSAENILVWCWEQLMFNGVKGIEKISLWESPDSIAVITKEDMLSIFRGSIELE